MEDIGIEIGIQQMTMEIIIKEIMIGMTGQETIMETQEILIDMIGINRVKDMIEMIKINQKDLGVIGTIEMIGQKGQIDLKEKIKEIEVIQEHASNATKKAILQESAQIIKMIKILNHTKGKE